MDAINSQWQAAREDTTLTCSECRAELNVSARSATMPWLAYRVQQALAAGWGYGPRGWLCKAHKAVR